MNIKQAMTRFSAASAMTLMMFASAHAEQKIFSQIEIQASPERVWSVLTDFEAYPQWSQFITSIATESVATESMHTPIPEVGNHLSITVVPPNEEGMDFTPELLVVEKNKELRWRGNIAGLDFLFSGEHYFKLIHIEDHQTLLVHGEVFDGWLVPLLWESISKNTPAGFEAFNVAIKRRAESI